MFKESKTGLGELWAEKIASELGKMLHLNMMNVYFAKSNRTIGVIMENFVPNGHTLIEGADLLTKAIPSFNVNSLEYYSIENIMNEIEAFKMEQNFIDLCIFDALIAGTDRHCENWGIIDSGTDYYFAPIYDNGSSLGFNLHQKKLELYERDLQAFKAFNNRTITQIEIDGKRKPRVKLLLNFLFKNYKDLFIKSMEKFALLNNDEVIFIINKIPLEIMNEREKQWVKRLVFYRYNWLMNFEWKEC